jgi:DNA-binding transcriptional regulator YiaG
MRDMINAGRQNTLFGESAGSHKLTDNQVLEIRENKDKLSQRKLAKLYGVGSSTIGSLILRKHWKHI